MQFLKDNEAVQIGEDVFVGKYPQYTTLLINDGVAVEGSFQRGLITFSSEDSFKRVIKGKRVIDYYVHENASMSSEQYHKIMFDNKHKYWDDDVEEWVYPDLETEYECKKKVLELEMFRPVYKEEPDTYEDYQFKVIGHSVDTGSKFILQPYSVGKAVWEHGRAAFQILASEIAKDEVNKAVSDHHKCKFDIPNHGNIEFVKLDGEYVFTKANKDYISRGNSTRYTDTLEDAKKVEQSIRADVRKHINVVIAKKYPKGVDEVTVQQLMQVLSAARNSHSNVEPKQKSSGSYRNTSSKLSEMYTMLENCLLEE